MDCGTCRSMQAIGLAWIRYYTYEFPAFHAGRQMQMHLANQNIFKCFD